MKKTIKGNAGKLALWIVVMAVVSVTPVPEVSADDGGDLVIFVNRTSTLGEVNIDELRLVFLKKRTRWDSGDKVIPVHAKEGTALREAFRAEILQMESYEEQSYWQNQQIRLGLDPPATFTNTQKAVFKLKNAVSYCFRRDLHADVVRVIKVSAR